MRPRACPSSSLARRSERNPIAPGTRAVRPARRRGSPGSRARTSGARSSTRHNRRWRRGPWPGTTRRGSPRPSGRTRMLARRINPGHAHAVAAPECVGPFAQGFHPPDDLMAGDDRQPGRRHTPFDLVEFGVTDPADAHPDQDFARGRRRVGPVGPISGAVLSLTGPSSRSSMAQRFGASTRITERDRCHCPDQDCSAVCPHRIGSPQEKRVSSLPVPASRTTPGRCHPRRRIACRRARNTRQKTLPPALRPRRSVRPERASRRERVSARSPAAIIRPSGESTSERRHGSRAYRSAPVTRQGPTRPRRDVPGNGPEGRPGRHPGSPGSPGDRPGPHAAGARRSRPSTGCPSSRTWRVGSHRE